MKKIILSLAVAVCCVGSSSAKIFIAESDRGECGYRFVSESHFGDMDALGCHDPGYCDCRFEQPLNQTPKASHLNLDDLNNEIKNIRGIITASIESGETSGSFISVIGNVTWAGTGSNIQYTIQ